jgi:hypothetical protein
MEQAAIIGGGTAGALPADAEPLLADLGDRGAVVRLDLVVVVGDLPLDLPLPAVGELDLKCSRRGEISAFWTVATLPASDSMSIESWMCTRASRILYTGCQFGGTRSRVLRTRSALPSTLYARVPAPFSIQKSSPMVNICSRRR